MRTAPQAVGQEASSSTQSDFNMSNKRVEHGFGFASPLCIAANPKRLTLVVQFERMRG